MKKSPLKRKSKSSSRKYQDILWALCRQITFQEYGNTCYTCGQTGLEGQNLQCGHMWPKASLGMHLKYDIRVLRPQCFRCNINLGGNGAVFYERMERENPKVIYDLLKEKQKLIKADKIWFENKIAEYQKLI